MFGSRSTIAAVAALIFGALAVSAQTLQQQYEACDRSIKLVDAQSVYFWEYDDPAFYNVTYTYDPTICNSSVPVNYIALTDFETGETYTCTRAQFTADGTPVRGQCVLRHGEMAIKARDQGSIDWTIELQIGSRRNGNQVVNHADIFRIAPPEDPPVDEAPAPTPSGTFQKKRRSIEAQHKFDCPAGQTYCWTGERQEYACMDTSSDVTACGRCPYAPGTDDFGGDCTSIEGADEVQCLRSKCVVNACQRGFQVSLDRTKCLDGSKRSIMSRGILF